MNESPASDEPFIRLDQLMKRKGAVQTGGHAKIVIQNGEVCVNGAVETRRGRKLRAGDVVQFEEWTISVNDDELKQ